MKYFLVSIISYLLGSFPNAYLVGKYIFHDDVRNYGSGNPGATNAFRAFGPKGGVLTLIFDFLKGFLAVYISYKIAGDKGELLGLTFAILGHMYTYILKFKGGKGVATAAGGLCAIDFKIFLLVLLVFLITFFLTRTVSKASIMACIFAPFIYGHYFGSSSTTWVITCLVIWIIIRHRSNIKRIIHGEEKKLF